MQALTTQTQYQIAATNSDSEQPQRLFQCSTCKRSFTRADHLTRHVRARKDLLKRHVTNHDSQPANKRQKREIARDTRVVQACEACSSSHLRCEDTKPCSQCKKKSIPCRVPEAPVSDIIENGSDAFHAAQDLLDLSHGFGFPSSISGSHDDTHCSLTPKSDETGSQTQFGHPSPMATANETMNVSSALHMGIRERSLTASSNIHPINQQYTEASGNELAYFDSHMPQFDETPIIDPFLPDYFRNMPPIDAFFSGQATPRGIMDLNFALDVNLTDLDVGLLDQYNFQAPFAPDTPLTDTQGLEQQLTESVSVPVRTDAFKQNIWRYLPHSDKDYGGSEQACPGFLADSEKDSNPQPQIVQHHAIPERLHRVSRDRLMALVLGTCSPVNVRRISSAFPSIELLDTLIQFFLTSPSLDAQSWFHLPTFSPSKLKLELLACIISAGAASTPDAPLRKLGFALHEASRIGQVRAFDEDNAATRDFEHIRTLLLQLQVGMWSGISRKMEMAESFLQPLMTMLRRGGRYRRSTWKEIVPTAEDEGASLEQKWQRWVEQESYLRVVYRAFELDRQSSMALLKPPLMSYSEMQLPLPSPNFLWEANTAAAWKSAYFGSAHDTSKRPTALETFLDLEQLAQYDSASTTYLHMVWGTVWEFRQMSSLTTRAHMNANNDFILSSRYQEITKQLEGFCVSSPPLSKSNEIILELLLVHLNAPLDNIQLFAGIEGQEEARNSYPVLRDWIKSSAARQALWHAGQILRAAAGLPRALLCNFNAIAVYHAGLILWSYGFLQRSTVNDLTPTENQQSTVILNGDDSLSARRFITLNSGIPSILHPRLQTNTQLSDVSGVMGGLIYLLNPSHDTADGSCPPLVGNLVQLLEGLRSATSPAYASRSLI